jgi:hypothetical protein
MTEKTCAERIDKKADYTLGELRRLWESYCQGTEEYEGEFHEYGLEFNYREPEAARAHWYYLITCGGPHIEIRFYADSSRRLMEVSFCLGDWGDWSEKFLTGDDKTLCQDIWAFFDDCGVVDQTHSEFTV